MFAQLSYLKYFSIQDEDVIFAMKWNKRRPISESTSLFFFPSEEIVLLDTMEGDFLIIV